MDTSRKQVWLFPNPRWKELGFPRGPTRPPTSSSREMSPQSAPGRCHSGETRQQLDSIRQPRHGPPSAHAFIHSSRMHACMHTRMHSFIPPAEKPRPRRGSASVARRPSDPPGSCRERGSVLGQWGAPDATRCQALPGSRSRSKQVPGGRGSGPLAWEGSYGGWDRGPRPYLFLALTLLALKGKGQDKHLGSISHLQGRPHRLSPAVDSAAFPPLAPARARPAL